MELPYMEDNASCRSHKLPYKKPAQCQVWDTSPQAVSQEVPEIPPKFRLLLLVAHQNLRVRPPLLRTPHTLATGPEGIKLALNWKLIPCWLVHRVLKGAMRPSRKCHCQLPVST